MIRKYKLLIIFQLMALSSFAVNTSYAKENNALIITEKDVSSLGFRTTKNYRYNSLCRSYEKTTPDKVSYQGFKSIKAVKGFNNMYYRFTLIKEIYADEALASSNLKKIQNTKGNTWYSKTCGIKKGLQIKNVLYFLSTDVGIFSSKLTPILKNIVVRLRKT